MVYLTYLSLVRSGWLDGDEFIGKSTTANWVQSDLRVQLRNDDNVLRGTPHLNSSLRVQYCRYGLSVVALCYFIRLIRSPRCISLFVRIEDDPCIFNELKYVLLPS